MRRFLSFSMVFVMILFLSVMANAQVPGDQDTKWFKIIQDYFQNSCRPGGDVWKDWQQGMRREFKLDLKEMHVRLEFVGIEKDETNVLVGLITEINCLCLDRNGLKKRVTINRASFVLIDRATEKILGESVFNQVGPKVFEGWNGKDC